MNSLNRIKFTDRRVFFIATDGDEKNEIIRRTSSTAEMNLPGRQKTEFSALILSSGLSERMGQPKALLKWDPSMTFIEKIIKEYLEAGCQRVVCTVNSALLPTCLEMDVTENVSFLLNEHPEWGRLHSVRLGLTELFNTDFCFVQNVDNPFINSATIVKIREAADPNAWCSPEFEGKGGHPVLLPQLITRKIQAESSLSLTLQEMLQNFPKKIVVISDDCVLKNINTLEDYRNLSR
jgi:CTP:molybdopterin cytidylyltransferase MocA